MSSENNSLDLEKTSLSAGISSADRLGNNPVSEFEADKRTLLQKSLANAKEVLGLRPSVETTSPQEIQTFSVPSTARQNAAVNVRDELPKADTQKKQAVGTEKDEDEEEAPTTGWGKIGSGLSDFCGAVWTLTKKAWNADWKTIGSYCLKATNAAIDAVGKGIVYVYNNPDKIWEGMKSAGKFVWQIGEGLVKGGITEAYNMITNPVETMKRLGSFLKGFSDQIGLTDIVMGAYHVCACSFCLATGQFKEAARHAKESTRAVAGALTAIGELTGITDLGRAVIALSKGEYGKAAFFGSMGALQIYLIFTSFGVGNLLSKSGVEAAKQGAKILAKETGRDVVQQLEKKISNSLLEQVGTKIALVSERLILKDWKNVVLDLYTNVKKIVSNTAEKLTEKMMRDHGAKEIVTQSTDKLLEKISTSKVSQLAEEFAKEGIKWRDAKYMAKCLKKALWKRGRNSRYHDILAEEITDEITSQVKENFMERGLKKGFEETWEKSAARIAKLKGLSDDGLETLLKAGKEGFEEGVTRGIRKVVREGVEESFKKYRGRRDMSFYKQESETGDVESKLKIKANEAEPEVVSKKKKHKVMSRRKKPEDEDVTIRDADGSTKLESREKGEKKYIEVG